jgi:hypothetical protein
MTQPINISVKLWFVTEVLKMTKTELILMDAVKVNSKLIAEYRRNGWDTLIDEKGIFNAWREIE